MWVEAVLNVSFPLARASTGSVPMACAAALLPRHPRSLLGVLAGPGDIVEAWSS